VWLSLGDARSIVLADARRLTAHARSHFARSAFRGEELRAVAHCCRRWSPPTNSIGPRRTICGRTCCLDHKATFGRDAEDRVASHKTSSVTDVYDRHGYADEDRRLMSAIARHVLGIVEGAPAGNVVNLR
jgi:hypothetical protein